MVFKSSRVYGGFSLGEVPLYGREVDLPPVSVIVPFGSKEYAKRLSRCLVSIRKQEHIPKEKVEVILVHIGRKEEDLGGIVELAKAHDALLLSGTKSYSVFPLSLAKNAGARVASNDLLFFVDCDMLLDPEAIARCVRQEASFCTIWALYLSEKQEFVSYKNSEAFRLCVRSLKEKGAKLSTVGYGGGLLVPRELFEHIGGYDEVYDQGWGAEDNDIVDRLYRVRKEQGFAMYSLSVGESVVSAHLWHKTRHTRTAGTQRNRERYDTLMTNIRNPGGWGNIALQEYTEAAPVRKATVRAVEKTGRLPDSSQLHPSVSVILCASSDRYVERLRDCLWSIRSQVGVNHNDVQLVVSTARHEDVSIGKVLKVSSFFGATVCGDYQPEPAYNLARGRNAGAAVAKGQVLFFVDVDAVFLPRDLCRILRTVQRGCYSLVRAVYGTEHEVYRQMSARAIKDIVASREPSNTGAFLLVPRNVYNAVNGYDEEYVGWGAEDSDFYKRLSLAGFEKVESGIKVYHQWHKSRFEEEKDFVRDNRKRFCRTDLAICAHRGATKGGVTTAVLHHTARPVSCLLQVLDSLDKAVGDREHVVDLYMQGEGAGDQEVDVSKYGFDLVVHQSEKNLGIPYPCSRSIQNCLERGHDWWAKVDDDILMPARGIEFLLDVFSCEDSIGDVVLGAVQMSTGAKTHAHIPKIFALSKDGVLERSSGYALERERGGLLWKICDCVGSGGTVFRSALFREGVIDIDTRVLWGSDSDLCYQLRHQGYRVALVQEPTTEHLRHCYTPKYMQIRQSKEDLDASLRVFGDKWGVRFRG